MQEHLISHISTTGLRRFSKDISVTFTDKTDSSDPLQ